MNNVRKPKEVLKDFFDIKGDMAAFNVIEERVQSGSMIKGTNMAILIFAIFIASVGLNVNSTAVIIGAMLVSPLMGTIIGMGYGIASANVNFFRNAAMGFLFQVVISLATSTIYFAISPLTTATEEILARTSPTIWDVLIATFGGLAGAVGLTRKDNTGNILPGVAIATALMPPLCTAGFGIANHSLRIFGGAIYLFAINTYFIAFSTVVVLAILKVPVFNGSQIHKSEDGRRTKARKKKLRTLVIVVTIIFIIPSIIIGAKVVYDQVNEYGQIEENKDNYDTKVLTKELTLLFDEVADYRIGEIDSYNAENDVLEKQLVAMVYLNSEIDEQKKNKITDLIKVHADVSRVDFVVNTTQ